MSHELMSPLLLFIVGAINGCFFLCHNRYTKHYQPLFQSFIFFLGLQLLISEYLGAVSLARAFYFMSVAYPAFGLLSGLFVGHLYGKKLFHIDDCECADCD